MKNLGVTSLYAVMLHTTPPLSTNNGDIYWNTLQELREQGVIQKIGYSIYENMSVTSSNSHKVEADIEGGFARISIGRSF